jgi:uncharacterized protein (DUF1800 family)
MVEHLEARQIEASRRSILKTLGLGVAAAGVRPAVARSSTGYGSGPLAMRRADEARGASEQLPTAPNLAVIALNRMGYGPRPGQIGEFIGLGGSPEERIAAYVAQQLDPDSIDDSWVESKIAAANFYSVQVDPNPYYYLLDLWRWYVEGINAPGGETSSSIPRDELREVTLLRALFSKRQLVEVMTEFWHNHFNVYIDTSSWVRATMPHLDTVIRSNVFGNFRALLEKVAKSPAMLRYLDNYTNRAAGPNENFSRELFELHTLGAENYLGVMDQNEVPTDGDGRPVGYVDDDIFESTRCLTGWSFAYGTEGDPDNGTFYYRPEWHDRFQKNVLGVYIPDNQADLQDGLDLLDALASHPGTGRHIARKLCQRFISDDPPQSVVDAAAAKFTARWRAPDQIKQVLEVILLSEEFASTWGEKIKRPFEIATSALRAGAADWTPGVDSGDTWDFMWRFRGTGQNPFGWASPNGYPDTREAWESMTPRVMSWRLCGWLIEFRNDAGNYYMDVVAQTPEGMRSANDLVDFWTNRILGRDMQYEDREELVEFMAQGFNPDLALNFNDDDTRERLRSLVGLIFMSPEFLWR